MLYLILRLYWKIIANFSSTTLEQISIILEINVCILRINYYIWSIFISDSSVEEKFIFRKIEDVNVDKEENLFVDDYGNRKILQFDSNWTLLLFSFRGKCEEEEGKFNRPRGIDFNSGNNIYVSKRNNYHIQKFESRDNFITQWISMEKEKTLIILILMIQITYMLLHIVVVHIPIKAGLIYVKII